MIYSDIQWYKWVNKPLSSISEYQNGPVQHLVKAKVKIQDQRIAIPEKTQKSHIQSRSQSQVEVIPVITYKPSQPAHHLVKMGFNVSSCIPTKASGTSMVIPIGSDPSHTGQTINGGSDSIGESDIGSPKDCQTTGSFNSICKSTSEQMEQMLFPLHQQLLP